MQNRYKSKVVWASFASAVLSIIVAFGLIDVGQSDLINAVVSAVLALLTGFGILNNPTDGTAF